MKILKQEPKESYRSKKIKQFLDTFFPIKELVIPSEKDLKLAVLRKVASEKGKTW